MIDKYPVITLCGSTRSEIEYARSQGKTVEFLDQKSPFFINQQE